MSRLRLFTLALLSIGLTACLDTTAPTYATVEGTTFNSALGVDLANSTHTEAGVYYRDITVGTGAVVAPGVENYMYYQAYLSNGVEFDSLKAGNPAPITTGNGSLIPGFEIGLQGMRIGGVRQIIIPPALGYGLSDFRSVPGNSVLVFNVRLVNADGTTGTTATSP
jgi:FKBP-type peptidyl-prolyl cis-trans isomerase FkpA